MVITRVEIWDRIAIRESYPGKGVETARCAAVVIVGDAKVVDEE